MSDIKERGGATQGLVSAIQNNAIVKAIFPKVGVNYAIAIISFLGGMFLDFPQETVNSVTLQLFGVTSGFQLLYTYFKNAKLNILAWIRNENTYAALFTVFTTFGVVIPEQVFTELGSLVNGIFEKDIRAILISLSYLTTIIINLVRNATTTAAPATAGGDAA